MQQRIFPQVVTLDSLKTRSALKVGQCHYTFFSLEALGRSGFKGVETLPFSLKVLLENLLRHEDGTRVKRVDIETLAGWDPRKPKAYEIAFTPARVLLQDFTGVPAVVDLAAMRDAMKRLGGDPKKINPLLRVDLVIDHSVQVDDFGTRDAFQSNVGKEFERNRERYVFLRWGQKAFQNFHVVPPGTGIVHQVNLEYLADAVFAQDIGSETFAYPDTLVGADSHTTMVNGLGVLGWGVGGIEAEAAMLGQPFSMLIPDVIGVEVTDHLKEGVTATDVVLTITEMLRRYGVVGKFVEFFGPGLDHLSLPDRATLANMCPEYGATVGFFPIDQETLDYLKLTGRSQDLVQRVETYAKEQGLFRTAKTLPARFSDTLKLDLSQVEPSLAGPRRPQDRVPLTESKHAFRNAVMAMQIPQSDPSSLNTWLGEGGTSPDAAASLQVPETRVVVKTAKEAYELRHGSVVIAAITSCTNTSNPSVMIGAGLLAKKAVERGLTVKPWVKTSLAPGSKVVMDYLKRAGLLKALEKLNFYLVGYGCTTCIGNSGPLPEPIGRAVKEKDLVVVAVLSGNRNFEGRINPLVRANYLASPPLVVAYAIAGRMDVNLRDEPIGKDSRGKPVYLKELWPSVKEIHQAMASVAPEMFRKRYRNVFEGDSEWQSLKVPSDECFAWDTDSTYVKSPPYFEEMKLEPPSLQDIRNARVLALLGDTVTTDHISPAGSIPPDSPAGQYLIAQGVSPKDFNSYGARRGNHEVMIRGTFGNIRLKNTLAGGREGGWTTHHPDGKLMTIYEAAMQYVKEGVPLIVIAGKEYGSGSSRDWAAKGTRLLGVRAVIAESFERIHRSNLLGMGVLPLAFQKGESAKSLGLNGTEVYTIEGIENGLSLWKMLTVTAQAGSTTKRFQAIALVETPDELAYYQHGGILPYVLRQLMT